MDAVVYKNRERQRILLQERSQSIRDGIFSTVRSDAVGRAESHRVVESPGASSGAISKDAVRTAWTYAATFKKRHMLGIEADETQTITMKTLLNALRSVDPNISFAEVEWVMGKENATNDTPVSVDEFLDMMAEDLPDFDPLEHSFHYICDAEGHMDMEKVRDTMILSGELGVTETILSAAVKRMVEEQAPTHKKKKGPIEFRDYRKLFSMKPSGLEQGVHVSKTGQTSMA